MSKAAADFKAGQKQIWGTVGDYPTIAKLLEPVSEIAADLLDEPDGSQVLDACAGNGNFAIAASERGAQVTALDLSPELIEKGAERTLAAGHEIRWVEGDVEELPFADDSFDAVVSVFGAIFAPRHAVAAKELARVCRPGGRIVMTAWTPDGFTGRSMSFASKLMGGPPKGVESPVSWGTEHHAKELFGEFADVQTQERFLAMRFDTVLEFRRFWELKGPPFAAVRPVLKEQGKLEELNKGMLELIAEFNKTSLGTTCEIDSEYLVIVARKHDMGAAPANAAEAEGAEEPPGPGEDAE